jgi:MFS family permease
MATATPSTEINTVRYPCSPEPGSQVETCTPPEPYTIFNDAEKRMMMALAGFAMLFSPLTANIYFPAMSQLETDLGASATVAVSYGLVADIVTAAERGGVIGVTMIATNLGPALAPLIGGAILGGSGSWQWIFWFLLLCGTFELLLLLILLPETARGIVGNGTVRPPAWRRPLLSVFIPSIPILKHGENSVSLFERPIDPTERPGRIPNPLRSVRVIFYKDSSLVLLISGVFYMIYYCLQASIALMFCKQYLHFDDTIIGACYLYRLRCCGGRLPEWPPVEQKLRRHRSRNWPHEKREEFRRSKHLPH